jgi:predicted RecB family nuclease
LPGEHPVKRVSATHVYTFLSCPRAVELDLHGDRARRRPLTDAEEFALRRGRELEARIVAPLGYAQPAHAPGDFEAGAAATLALLRQGVEGVHQGVLCEPPLLGVPDLLRRATGASALGAHHYVVGDVKSSARPRGDQILQVTFYHRLLARLQEREPEYAFLVLKDGSEERFDPREYAPALDEVQAQVCALAAGSVTTRPFLAAACGSCRWWPACEAELQAGDDLALLQGMTRGLRAMLERAGVRTCAAAGSIKIETVARQTHLEPTLLRRIKRAAQARAAGMLLPERQRAGQPFAAGALVHLLTDAFADRVLWFGARLLGSEHEAAVREALPAGRADELSAFLALIDALPREVALLHYGPSLPRWFEGAAWNRRAGAGIEPRVVDIARRLRGAAVYPAPVFGAEEHVRQALGRDPHRCGRAAAAASWADAADGAARLRAKGRADLEDLAALVAYVLAASGAPRCVEGELHGSVA